MIETIRLLELVAAKTHPKMDDEIVGLLKDVALSDPGGRLIDYTAAKIQGVFNESA